MTETPPQARKPVIFSVDDDPAVSRAVARDLRRHYGERYRIMRAESGSDALAALKELRLRGDTVAVFVADYRMPQMSGIQFLEEAMDIYPMARRVLLTAYADTHAAIDAINVVDLDRYLLKPWDPPEEKLYPILDALLEAWHATGDRAIPHTRVIGHRWSERSWEIRQFLARNQHSFRAYTAEEPRGRQLLDAAGLGGDQLPVVITERGETLVNPTDAELAGMLGLSTTPSLEMYDLAVIGGGPAGLAAAVYGHRRAGWPQLADRELSRLPHRRLRRRVDHVGTAAGRTVRRRGDHHPQGRRAHRGRGRDRPHRRFRGRR
jgi:thioredoxin reductase (NADPH)